MVSLQRQLSGIAYPSMSVQNPGLILDYRQLGERRFNPALSG
jgi:hypothetical protein